MRYYLLSLLLVGGYLCVRWGLEKYAHLQDWGGLVCNLTPEDLMEQSRNRNYAGKMRSSSPHNPEHTAYPPLHPKSIVAPTKAMDDVKTRRSTYRVRPVLVMFDGIAYCIRYTLPSIYNPVVAFVHSYLKDFRLNHST